MNTYYVYLLKCADGSYFSGITNDIDRKLKEHCLGQKSGCWTYSRRPLKLVFLTSSDDPGWALDLDKRIKKWKRSRKRTVVSETFDAFPGLSLAKWAD